MRFQFLFKSLAVLGLSLLLLIPLLMTQGLVEGRNQRRMATELDVARLSAGPQELVGPLLVIPYICEELKTERDDKTGLVKSSWQEVSKQHIITPRTLQLDGAIEIEARRRGLYKTQVYKLNGTLTGTFALEAGGGVPEARNRRLGRPFVTLGVQDPRGILNQAHLAWSGHQLPFKPGTQVPFLPNGIHASLKDLNLSQDTTLPFHMPLELLGTSAFRMAPMGEETMVSLKGAWHAPSFEGNYAPTQRSLSPQGFTATWKIPHLSRDLVGLLQGGPRMSEQTFGVAFIDPVNLYLLSERATKYGFLFVVLTFAAFLLREALHRRPIHPVQYLLVGLALAIFFLLLLSLSEHLGFDRAYLVAAGANLLLVGTYLTGALRSCKEACVFSTGLAALYGALYALLMSEDNALLLGSLLLFALLGGIMLGTRHMDWTQTLAPPEPPELPRDPGKA